MESMGRKHGKHGIYANDLHPSGSLVAAGFSGLY